MENIKLSDFLIEDSVVKTKLEKSETWIPNIAYKISSDMGEIEIALDDRYLEFLVMVGDNIELTQTIDKFEYIINAIITQIRIEPTRTMLLKVKDINKVENLRKDERYSVNYATTIQSFSEVDGVFGVVVNISVSGLAADTVNTGGGTVTVVNTTGNKRTGCNASSVFVHPDVLGTQIDLNVSTAVGHILEYILVNIRCGSCSGGFVLQAGTDILRQSVGIHGSTGVGDHDADVGTAGGFEFALFAVLVIAAGHTGGVVIDLGSVQIGFVAAVEGNKAADGILGELLCANDFVHGGIGVGEGNLQVSIGSICGSLQSRVVSSDSRQNSLFSSGDLYSSCQGFNGRLY